VLKDQIAWGCEERSERSYRRTIQDAIFQYTNWPWMLKERYKIGCIRCGKRMRAEVTRDNA
jgi:hypothetical protein